MSRALSIKSSIRIIQLKLGAKVNRATNSVVESLAETVQNINTNTLMALDAKQDAAYDVAIKEIDRIAAASEKRVKALKTAIAQEPDNRWSKVVAVNKATDI